MQTALKTNLKRSLMRTLHYARVPAMMPAGVAGIGLILMLHRVRPDPGHDFAPHFSLEITPAFLEQLIERLRAARIEIVDLDEAARRLEMGQPGNRFVCITLDDGYLDNYEHARPIFERHEVPYAIYLATGLPDRHAILWWLVLEEQIRARDHVAAWLDGEIERHATATLAAKRQAYLRLHQRFRSLSASACAEAARRLCEDCDVDPAAHAVEHGMTWDMARRIASSQFGRIEAHTTQHMAVSRQTSEAMIEDIEAGIDRTFSETGEKPRHFAYPYGDPAAAGPREFAIMKDLPLVSATTTVEGVLHARHQFAMEALPRLCVNGYYQSDAYIDLLLCGMTPLLAPGTWTTSHRS